MVNLLFRNLGLTAIVTMVWLVTALAFMSGDSFILFGGFWVLVFGFVCWRIAVSMGSMVETDERSRYSANQLHLRLAGLMLAVLAVQVVLLTLAVSFVEGNEIAGKALLFLIGSAGSTSLAVPLFLWFRSKFRLQRLAAFLLFAGLFVWWEVARNLWPDELFLAPVIGLVTFAISALLLRWTLKLPAPNRTTQRAMDELDHGKGKRFDSAEELFEDLGS